MLGSLFNFSRRDSNTGVSCGYCEIFKNSFFIENLQWLLLKVLPQYSKVSCGVCSLILHFHMLSNLIKNLHKALHKWFFTITYQNNFFLAWIDLSRAFDFRIYFGKTLKIPILILFHFCLLCWSSPVSIVAASCFNYIGLVGGFSSF